MTLQQPFCISSRLLPALKIGDTTISLEYVKQTSDGRDEYRIWFDMPDGREIRESGLRSGCNGASTQEMFASLLSFFSAAAEAYSYGQRTGRESDNADLFSAEIMLWADEHSDEIGMLACEVEETADLIVD